MPNLIFLVGLTTSLVHGTVIPQPRGLQCLNVALTLYITTLKVLQSLFFMEIITPFRHPWAKYSGANRVKVTGINLKQSHTFKYLVTRITSDGKCITGMKNRIGQAKTAFL